jgi:hypothetical protein
MCFSSDSANFCLLCFFLLTSSSQYCANVTKKKIARMAHSFFLLWPACEKRERERDSGQDSPRLETRHAHWHVFVRCGERDSRFSTFFGDCLVVCARAERNMQNHGGGSSRVRAAADCGCADVSCCVWLGWAWLGLACDTRT